MSKRFNLREFQQQVLDRLQARTAGESSQSALGIQLGQENWLVEMSDIGEVLPLPALTPVPLTNSWYCGVANVRGTLYSIVDLGAYMGNDATPRETHNRVLLIGQRFAFNAGLLVSRVFGLRNTHDWKQQEIGGELRLQDADGQVWRKLDITNLLQHPDFLRISA